MEVHVSLDPGSPTTLTFPRDQRRVLQVSWVNQRFNPDGTQTPDWTRKRHVGVPRSRPRTVDSVNGSTRRTVHESGQSTRLTRVTLSSFPGRSRTRVSPESSLLVRLLGRGKDVEGRRGTSRGE